LPRNFALERARTLRARDQYCKLDGYGHFQILQRQKWIAGLHQVSGSWYRGSGGKRDAKQIAGIESENDRLD